VFEVVGGLYALCGAQVYTYRLRKRSNLNLESGKEHKQRIKWTVMHDKFKIKESNNSNNKKILDLNRMNCKSYVFW
jgi:hypothetical protein